MTYSLLNFFVTLILLASPTNSQSTTSARCLAQTARLHVKPRIAKSTLHLHQTTLLKLRNCFRRPVTTNCVIDAELETYDLVAACVIAGGQAYRPIIAWTCDNVNVFSNMNIDMEYATCLGSSCNTNDISEAWSVLFENVTSAANIVLSNYGIECQSNVSGAERGWVSKALGGVLLVMGLVAAFN